MACVSLGGGGGTGTVIPLDVSGRPAALALRACTVKTYLFPTESPRIVHPTGLLTLHVFPEGLAVKT